MWDRVKWVIYCFFPNVINEWYKRDPNICSSSNYHIFGNTLLKFIRPIEMIIFDINDPFGKVLKRLRLGFGKFREHKFRQGFKDTLNSLCSCGIEAETTAQYFLISHLYNSIRATFTVEAVAQRCSVKKVFLKILQNSQEITCARASFLIKL